MRTIDADALMPLFMKKANTMKDRHGVKLGEEWLLNYNDIKDVIDKAPTVERPQGEWIYHKGLSESRECSVCGVWLDWSLVRNSFCPNCGADMRGGREFVQ